MSGRPAGAPAASLPETPYVGLVPYTEAEADFFFGRDHESRIVAGNLRAARLTILYGPSGVGKTSLLQARVVRDLREQARPAPAERRLAESEPGLERRPLAVCTFRAWQDDPLPGLAEALRAATAAAAGRDDVPAWRPGTPLLEAARAWTEHVRAILVVLDQFEEYFLYHAEESGEGTLADELPALVNEPNLRVNVLLSLREDAWAKLDRFEARIPRLFSNYIRVDHLDREAGRAAIRGPIGEWNRRLPPAAEPVAIEEQLVEAVLDAAATGASPGALAPAPAREGARREAVEAPFLQLVLERLWHATVAAGSRDLTVATLRELGGAQQIVESHLLDALGRLAPAEQAAAADLFRFLVTRTRTKIAHSTSDLAEWTGRPEPEATAVLEQLSRAESGRILRRVPPPDPEHEAMRYELFHDVLAEPILEWRRAHDEERARRAALRRLLRIGGILLSLVVVFAALSAWALLQRSEAERATRAAASLALAATAEASLGERPDDALLLALEAYSASPTPDAAGAMVAALEAARRSGVDAILHAGRGRARAVALAPDGRTLASAGFDGTIRLWDVRERRRLEPPLLGHVGQVWSIAFSPDGRTLASAGFDGSVRLWDVATAAQAGELRARSGPVVAVAFSPEGRFLASGGEDALVRLWDVRARREAGPPLAGHAGRVGSVAFAADGRTLASGGYDNTVRLWDLRTHEAVRPALQGHTDHVVSVTFDPGGRTLASADLAGVIRFWDTRDGSRLGQLPAGTGDVWSVAFAPDGRTLASSGFDGTVRLWDARTREPLAPPLRGHSDRVVSVAFGPDGRTLASSGYDGTVRLWRTPVPPRLGRPLPGRGHADRVESVAWSPDGRLLASAGGDRTVRLWDARARRGLGPLPAAAADAFESVAFGPSGDVVAAGGRDGRVRLWDPRSRRPLGAPFGDHEGAIESIAFAASGDVLASGGADGSVRLWDVESRRRVGLPLLGHEREVWSVAFGSDGDLLASAGNDGTVRLWDLRAGGREGTVLHRSREGALSNPIALALVPDGSTLAVGTVGGAVRLWDAEARSELGEPLRGHGGRVESLAFSADGRLLATAGAPVGQGEDGELRLWDVRGRKQLGPPLRGHAGRVAGVAFAPDGRALASAGHDGTVRLWEGVLWSDRDDLREQVCRLVVGSLSESEWAELAPGLAYRSSCP